MAHPVVELSVTKTLVAWAERATKQGLDLSTELQPSIDAPEQMQRLVHYMQAGCPPMKTAGITYDAATVSRILGIPVECGYPVPQARDGEIVVYYGGWDMKQLRTSAAGQKRMWQDQNWYEKYGWKVEPGYYRLLLPVPDSNRKTWNYQISYLAGIIGTAWKPAPICVAAASLLVHLTETGNDLLKNDWCRCAEALPDDSRAVLAVRGGRVRVFDGWDDRPSDRVWLSAARKVRTLKS